MGYIWAILGGYLLGCSSMAFYLSKLSKKDIRKNGSGNLGASNTMALLGWKAAVLVGVHDIGKGVLAVLLARWSFPELEYIGAVAGVACVLGHIFPFYLKFKGGKGLASYLGMLAALDWRLGIVIALLLVLVTVITNFIALGTLTTIVVAPAVTLFAAGWIVALILCAASVVMVFKHLENIRRIVKGEEIGFRNAAKGKHRMR